MANPIAAGAAAQAMIIGEPGDIFAPNCVSWHNWDQVEVSTNPDVFDGTRSALRITPDLHLADVVVNQITDDLSVARYRVRGTFPGGQEMDAPGALFVYTAGGRVVRTEEYLDSAQTLALYTEYGADPESFGQPSEV